MQTEILKKNRNSWNTVAKHFNGVDALPSYGPYAQEEGELQLMGDITGKNVLDIGCGSGHSLRYMAERGAHELWGVDFSEAQIETAEETLKGLAPRLFCAPMEAEIGLPIRYFDMVYSIYAVGWTTDLSAVFNLVYSYLKPGGSFIFSWDHPLYMHITSKDGQFYLEGSYQKEEYTVYNRFKGEDAPVQIPKRKMSTYINELIQSGFTIDRVIESEPAKAYDSVEEEESDRYYSLYKARRFPSAMIIKAVKK